MSFDKNKTKPWELFLFICSMFLKKGKLKWIIWAFFLLTLVLFVFWKLRKVITPPLPSYSLIDFTIRIELLVLFSLSLLLSLLFSLSSHTHTPLPLPHFTNDSFWQSYHIQPSITNKTRGSLCDSVRISLLMNALHREENERRKNMIKTRRSLMTGHFILNSFHDFSFIRRLANCETLDILSDL